VFVTATGTAYVSIASEYGPEEEEEEEACVYFCASRAGKKEREDRGNTNRQRLHTDRQTERKRERRRRGKKEERDNSNFFLEKIRVTKHRVMQKREREKKKGCARAHSPWQSRSLPPELENVPLALLRAFFSLLL